VNCRIEHDIAILKPKRPPSLAPNSYTLHPLPIQMTYQPCAMILPPYTTNLTLLAPIYHVQPRPASVSMTSAFSSLFPLLLQSRLASHGSGPTANVYQQRTTYHCATSSADDVSRASHPLFASITSQVRHPALLNTSRRHITLQSRELRLFLARERTPSRSNKRSRRYDRRLSIQTSGRQDILSGLLWTISRFDRPHLST
jgi:hypothetical protein